MIVINRRKYIVKFYIALNVIVSTYVFLVIIFKLLFEEAVFRMLFYLIESLSN